MTNEVKKYQWLEKRLAELGKKNYELADYLGIQHNKISQIKAGTYNFQPEHLSSVAEFLNFDKSAFVDFVAEKITEQQLWDAKPPLQISDADLQLLRAVKNIAVETKEVEDPKNTQIQSRVSEKAERGER